MAFQIIYHLSFICLCIYLSCIYISSIFNHLSSIYIIYIICLTSINQSTYLFIYVCVCTHTQCVFILSLYTYRLEVKLGSLELDLKTYGSCPQVLKVLILSIYKVLNHSEVNSKPKNLIWKITCSKFLSPHHLHLLYEVKNEMLVTAHVKPKFLLD